MMPPGRVLSIALLAVVAVMVALSYPTQASAAVVEGVIEAHHGYSHKTKIFATVDSYRSVQGLTPYNFYSIPVPKPAADRFKTEKVGLNLGQMLLGSREQPSNYAFTVGENLACGDIGTGTFTKKDLMRAFVLAAHGYHGNMFLDGLRAMSRVDTPSGPTLTPGFQVGTKNTFNNFLHFNITYRNMVADKFFITDFTVEPASYFMVLQCSKQGLVTDKMNGFNPFDSANPGEDGVKIKFHYSVLWVEDKEKGVLFRLDQRDPTGEAGLRQRKGHWTAGVNAVLLALLLGVGVAMVLARTVRRDLLKYADAELAGDALEETGWKLVRGDVFRPPSMPVHFSCLVAAGCQTLFMFGSGFLLAGIGILHPAQRGNLLTGLVACFLVASFVAGYVGARMLKFFQQRSWTNGLMTVVAFPLTIATYYMTLNWIHLLKRSSSSISFFMCVGIVFAWFALSIPLGIAGVTLGFRAAAISAPVRVTTIPRLIPAESARELPYHLVFGGLIPFSAGFIELVYLLSAVWQGEPLYSFGLVTAVGSVVAILCGEAGIVVTYLSLNHEDYRWWWRSFLSLASAGAYLLLYSLFYLVMYLELRLFSAVVLFCGYSLGLSAFFALMCGTIGFISSAIFVYIIYAATKGD